MLWEPGHIEYEDLDICSCAIYLRKGTRPQVLQTKAMFPELPQRYLCTAPRPTSWERTLVGHVSVDTSVVLQHPSLGCIMGAAHYPARFNFCVPWAVPGLPQLVQGLHREWLYGKCSVDTTTRGHLGHACKAELPSHRCSNL